MRGLIQLTVAALLVLQPSVALAKSEWVIVTAGGNGDRPKCSYCVIMLSQ